MNIKEKNVEVIIKFIIFIVILIIIAFIASRYAPNIIKWIKQPSDVRKYMLSIGIIGNILQVLLLVAHVFIVVIPGDLLYLLGGYVFGLPMGFILSYTGVMVGGFLVFNFSRLLGYDFVQRVVSKDKMEKANKILNSVKGMFGLFIICIIPVFPKSTIMYVLGLTPIKPLKLFSVYALSRIPVIFIWTAVGSNAYERNYLQMFIMISLLVLAAIFGTLLYNKILKK